MIPIFRTLRAWVDETEVIHRIVHHEMMRDWFARYGDIDAKDEGWHFGPRLFFTLGFEALLDAFVGMIRHSLEDWFVHSDEIDCEETKKGVLRRTFLAVRDVVFAANIERFCRGLDPVHLVERRRGSG